MTLNVIKNVAAENDLVDIWIYSFDKWGIVQADEYIEQLNEGFQLLASNPHVGNCCDKIRDGYFSFPIKKHTVFYTIENQLLRIIRVLGGEMNHCENLVN